MFSVLASWRALLAATVVIGSLAACERRQDPPQQPAAIPKEPDTASMGAAPLAANCGLRNGEALLRINAARATGRRCGARSMAPAPPLRWNEQLYAAAAVHSSDMARRNYFEHRSPEGREVSDRVSAARYRWKSVGENLAGGDRSIAEAVDGWLASPDHCETLMEPRYVDVAVACAAQPRSEWGTYWTMVLGRR
jgi:uncharacterized protein YkwD